MRPDLRRLASPVLLELMEPAVETMTSSGAASGLEDSTQLLAGPR